VQPTVGVVDYGAGNLHSVLKALQRCELAVRVCTRPDELTGVDGLVLPGVGSFGACMDRLQAQGMVSALQGWIQAERPFLGICLGLQILLEVGEENPGVRGLAVVPGRVRRLGGGVKVPHMGWNALRMPRPSRLLAGIPEGSYVYFVHSYHAEPVDRGWITAVADYGQEVTAALERGNLFAVQFHPEKSSRVGLRVLENFARVLRGG